jgi:hypothetical protein
MSIGWIITLVVAMVFDGIIRVVMFISDKRETYKALNTLWQQKATTGVNDLYSNFGQAINTNLHKFGIVGDFEVDQIKLGKKYGYVGDPTFVGKAIIKNKVYISPDDILNNMQSFIQNTGQSFDSTADAIEEKFIIEMYLKKDTTKQFTWDDRELFENVLIGDEVSVKYSDGVFGPRSFFCHGIGFEKKGNKYGKDYKEPDV